MSVDTFSLPNAGAGDDPFELKNAAATSDWIVLLFQRDFYCTNCRTQVQEVADAYEAFEERNAIAVSVLPEGRGRAEDWQDKYDLPYPLVADEDKAISNAFGQPVKFGPLGNLHDLIGRMPLVVILDARDGDPEVAYEYAGDSTYDRPSVERLLDEIDRLAEEQP